MEKYKIVNTLKKTSEYIIYSGYITDKNQPIYIKIFQEGFEYLLQKEYDILKDSKVIKRFEIFEKSTFNNLPALIFDDFEGVSLKKIIENKIFSIDEFLFYAEKLCNLIKEFHFFDIIHKQINSNNILINLVTKEMRIINFEKAEKLEKFELIRSDENIDDVNYISPEQTGSLNIPIDKRSDLYSLGIVFYEMISGVLPFQGDSIAVKNLHIAKKPESPIIHKPQIPVVISNIILKLINKNKNERYQSIIGLYFDIKKCVSIYNDDKKIENFEIGKKDIQDYFEINLENRLREKYKNRLINDYYKLLDGINIFTFIKGKQGIGKTKLVYNVINDISNNQFIFVNKSFEAVYQNSPYFLLMKIIDDIFVEYLKNRQDKNSLKEEILDIVKENGKILTDLSPNIKKLIGNQPTLQQLNPIKEKTRFNNIVSKFLNILCSKNRPIVIFFDNSHLIDNEVVRVLEEWIIKNKLKYIWIICAYRDEELTKNHPLNNLIHLVNDSNYYITKILLEDFTIFDLIDLLRQNFYSESVDFTEIAKIIKNRTEGNPLLLYQFLLNLYKKNILYFDHNKESWIWDLEKLQNSSNIIDYVDLSLEKIKSFNKEIQEILEAASCIGKVFDINLLSFLLNSNKEYISKILNELELQEYINKNNDNEYEFSHDRFLNTCYNLMVQDTREAFHYKISRYYLNNLTELEIENKIFEIVKHLNILSLTKLKRGDKKNLVKLNYKAGNKAKRISYYDISYKYFRKALYNIDDSWWKNDYEFTFDFYLATIEVAHINRKDKKVDNLINSIFNKTNSDIDKAKLLEVKTKSLISENKLKEAISTIIRALNLLDMNIPKEINYKTIFTNFILAKQELYLYNKGLKKTRVMTKEEDLIIDLISLAVIPSYILSSKLLPLLIFKGLRISINTNSNKRFQLYITYAMFILNLYNSYDEAFKIGEMAKHYSYEFVLDETKGRVMFALNTYILSWKENINNLIDEIKESQRILFEIGDIEYSSLASFNYIFYSFFCGKNLTKLNENIEREFDYVSRYKQYHIFSLLVLWKKTVSNFISKKQKFFLRQEDFNFDISLIGNQVEFLFNFINLMLSVYFENYDKGIESIKKIEDSDSLRVFSILRLQYIFYKNIFLIKNYSIDNVESKLILKNIKKDIKMFNKYRKHNSANLTNKYFLLRAEYENILDNSYEAELCYEKAINYSYINNFLHEEALSKELYGQYKIKRNANKIGHFLIKEAYICYKNWGNLSKLTFLEKKYPEIKLKSDDNIKNSELVDINLLLDINIQFSRETEINNLLKKLMDSSLKFSGADKGVIFIKDTQLTARCIRDLKNDSLNLINIPYNSCNEAPGTIIEYVNSYQKSLLIENVRTNDKFEDDLYLKNNDIKSIICIPIINRKKIVGMIYLENSLLENAFNTKIKKVIELLASQISITFESVILYQDMDQNKEKFKTLVDNLSEGVFIIQDKKFKYVNRSATKILGYSEDDLLEKYFLNFVSHDYKEIVKYNYLQRLDGETLTNQYEIELIHSSGKTIPVLLSAGVINYNNNYAIEGSIKDISDRREIEDMQRNYRDHLKSLVTKKTKNISNLLNNADQGFLTIDSNYKIIGEFSQECLNIYEKNIENENFINLTFSKYFDSEIDLIKKTLKKVFKENNRLKKDVYLSLLPKLVRLHNKHIELKYKFLYDENSVMVIITDITEKKHLQKEMIKERNNLKMIIKAISDSNSVKRSIDDYKKYTNTTIYDKIQNSTNLKECLIEIFREIHTFKGDLSQWNMSYVASKLSETETAISKIINDDNYKYNKEKLINFFDSFDFYKWIKNEEEIIKKRIGRDIFKSDEFVMVRKADFINIEKYILSNFSYSEYKELLPKIRRLRYINLFDIIKPYNEYIQQLAEKLDKKVSTIDISGEEINIDRDIYYKFSKALIHIFRNIVDHGIEYPDERLVKSKNEFGNIYCNLITDNNSIKIKICDDGYGLDLAKIKNKACELGIKSEDELDNMNNKELSQLIFEDNLSTKINNNDISGRGIGLSALKKEVTNLNGNISVFSKGKDSGCCFNIDLPIVENLKNYDISFDVLAQILSNHLKSFFLENINIDFDKINESQIDGSDIFLDKITSFISIKGMVFADVFISLEEKLAQKITDKFLIDKVEENEKVKLTKATIAEILNVIVGNSMQEFADKGILINIESPVFMYGDKVEINYSGKEIFTQNYISKDGKLNLMFIKDKE